MADPAYTATLGRMPVRLVDAPARKTATRPRFFLPPGFVAAGLPAAIGSDFDTAAIAVA
jgi:hypothetical protein